MIKRLSFFWKTILPIILIFPIVFFSLILFLNKKTFNNTVESTIISATNTIEQYKTLRGYYTKNIVKKVKSSDVGMRFHYEHKGLDKTLPLPATMIHELSQTFMKKEDGLRLRLYSNFPFPNRKERILDEFQKGAIEYFNKSGDGIYRKVYTESGKEHVRVAIADRLVAKACVSCHNAHPQTPFNKWKLGDVRGILEVEAPIKNQVALNRSMMSEITLYLFAFLSLFIVGASFFLKKLNFSLIQISQNLKNNAQEAMKGSSNLSNLSKSIKNQINEQSSSTKQAMNSLEQINQMVTQTFKTVEDSKDLSNQSSERVKNGQKAIGQMSKTIHEIQQSYTEINSEVKNNNEKFRSIVGIINEIAEKTKMINDIVFQTQLLSFNASVEAARAGDQGKGFAVVAEEVGNLAAMSGKSAAEISEILERSINAVEDIIKQTETGVASVVQKTQRSVDQGIENTEECERIFLNLVNEIGEVEVKMRELSSAANEQTSGVSEVFNNMDVLTSLSSNYGESAEKLNNLSRRLDEQSTDLKESIVKLEESVLGQEKK